MVETTAGRPNLTQVPKAESLTDFPFPPLVRQARVRFDELLEAFRKERREERHRKRVEALQKEVDEGVIVFTSRIEP